MISFLIALLAGCPLYGLSVEGGQLLFIPVTCDYAQYRLVGIRWGS